MSEDIELMPCPGGHAKVVLTQKLAGWKPECRDCNWSIGFFDSIFSAIGAWNRRVAPQGELDLSSLYDLAEKWEVRAKEMQASGDPRASLLADAVWGRATDLREVLAALKPLTPRQREILRCADQYRWEVQHMESTSEGPLHEALNAYHAAAKGE